MSPAFSLPLLIAAPALALPANETDLALFEVLFMEMRRPWLPMLFTEVRAGEGEI